MKYDRAKLYNGSLETYHLLGFVDQEKQPKFNTKWLLHALERFFASDDDELSIYHVPEINEIVERDHDNECVDVGEIQRTEVEKALQLHLYMYILLILDLLDTYMYMYTYIHERHVLYFPTVSIFFILRCLNWPS